MGLALDERVFDGFTKLDGLRHEREALRHLRKELRHIRLELGQLKRTGSQAGLVKLTSDALALSMRIKRLETSCNLRRRFRLAQTDCSTRY
jgi:hypothetical protein